MDAESPFFAKRMPTSHPVGRGASSSSGPYVLWTSELNNLPSTMLGQVREYLAN